MGLPGGGAASFVARSIGLVEIRWEGLTWRPRRDQTIGSLLGQMERFTEELSIKSELKFHVSSTHGVIIQMDEVGSWFLKLVKNMGVVKRWIVRRLSKRWGDLCPWFLLCVLGRGLWRLVAGPRLPWQEWMTKVQSLRWERSEELV